MRMSSAHPHRLTARISFVIFLTAFFVEMPQVKRAGGEYQRKAESP
jgi:hypothetical protein